MFRITGVYPTRIDGVHGCTTLKMISEIGTDMTRWDSADHFGSWLGLSPNDRGTGGRFIRSKTKSCTNQAAAALRLAADAMPRFHSVLRAVLHRNKAHPGASQAIPPPPQAGTGLLFLELVRPSVGEIWPIVLREPVSAVRFARGKTAVAQLGYRFEPIHDRDCRASGVPQPSTQSNLYCQMKDVMCHSCYGGGKQRGGRCGSHGSGEICGTVVGGGSV